MSRPFTYLVTSWYKGKCDITGCINPSSKAIYILRNANDELPATKKRLGKLCDFHYKKLNFPTD